MSQTQHTGSAPFTGTADTAVVRYHVRDVERAVTFYTQQLNFRLLLRAANAFATVARGQLHLLLGSPQSSGSRPLSDGRNQEPGGFNRIVLYVDDLDATIAKLQAGGVRVRSALVVGPGGKQAQIEDPDGNPIELHEAPKPA